MFEMSISDVERFVIGGKPISPTIKGPLCQATSPTFCVAHVLQMM